MPAPDASQLAANVVDIRRFSTHDGAGIRTTVFLKGCSLACQWCQNPETMEPRMGPVFFRKKCIDCMLCVTNATHGEATVDDDGHVEVDITVHEADWLAQVNRCPTGAITFNATRHTVAELVEILKRDEVFFGNGGGVTLSGGEPLFMPHFAAALLQALKAEGINTAIETALNVRTEFLLEALPYTDHVFADCKLIDPVQHKRWIGHDNELILKNLAVLLTGDRRDDVTVRTPMIPTVTDTVENIEGIARHISGLYPDVRYELLNYNPMAAAKYDVLPTRTFLFERERNPTMYSALQMDSFRQQARRAGVRNLVEV
ncbi:MULTISPECIES: glycyl-radical enzyme activating protein [unclassified Luteococcus]|uniref:glycyl-radical enzyme activating protein n=1 Tax=unclassified Luteococcus TaxID=2639923 RepID=UPI00313C42C7